MKTLLLMRHAKSSWKDDDLKDFDRPLKKRGKKDVPRMAEVIHEEDLKPEVIISSSALRARETAELVAETLKFKGKVEFVDALYMAEPPAYLDALRALPKDVERVMVIGHNPGLEALMQILSGKVEGMPTGAVAYIALPISEWQELNGKTGGELINLWRPRDFEEGGKHHKK
jgi:phosphohistidine phosphatase